MKQVWVADMSKLAHSLLSVFEKINNGPRAIEIMLQKKLHTEIGTQKISVIGLGKLGSSKAAILAHAGFEVVGLDVDQEFVACLENGTAPVKETGLQELLDVSGGNLTATQSYKDAIARTNVTCVIVPTPSNTDGSFDNKFVIQAIGQIGTQLRNKEGYHLVVVGSTVLPGSMDGEISSTLEKTSGKKIGPDSLGLCYNPEFIALGNIVSNMQNPDIILIGESDPYAGDLLESMHKGVVKNEPAVHRMNFVNAELTKISINTFVTTKISYANMLAELCDHLPNSDVAVVTNAVGSDSRVGKKYLSGAIGYGGPCFPRDNKALFSLGQKLGVDCDIAQATDRINDRQISRVQNYVKRLASDSKTVAILGLSYKPDTAEIECSQAIELCEKLLSEGYSVKVHDPTAYNNAKAVLSAGIEIVEDVSFATDTTDIIVIMTPWREYIDVAMNLPSESLLIDPWRLLICYSDQLKCTYVPMGQQ